MAKPKKKFFIDRSHSKDKESFLVYADNLGQTMAEIRSIEGVSRIFDLSSCLIIYIDPRYDLEEIMQETRDLLSAEVPDVFKDLE